MGMDTVKRATRPAFCGTLVEIHGKIQKNKCAIPQKEISVSTAAGPCWCCQSTAKILGVRDTNS
jgi:hypothetical protein